MIYRNAARLEILSIHMQTHSSILFFADGGFSRTSGVDNLVKFARVTIADFVRSWLSWFYVKVQLHKQLYSECIAAQLIVGLAKLLGVCNTYTIQSLVQRSLLHWALGKNRGDETFVAASA
jgi:hypothetical protein